MAAMSTRMLPSSHPRPSSSGSRRFPCRRSIDYLAGRLVDVAAGARGEAPAHDAPPLVLIDRAHRLAERPAVRHGEPHPQEMPPPLALRIVLKRSAGVEADVIIEELDV